MQRVVTLAQRLKDAFCIRQFTKYFVSGVAANVVDIGLFYLLLLVGMWYVQATIISGVVGFITAFLLHKYLVFNKREAVMNHFARFCLLGLFNLCAVTFILYLLVDFLEIPEYIAKIPANASVVLWNFFIYKLMVYV